MLSEIEAISCQSAKAIYVVFVKDLYLKNTVRRIFIKNFFGDDSLHPDMVSFQEQGYDVVDLIDFCLSQPLLGEKRLIFSDLSKDLLKSDHLQDYLDNPSPSTCLVFFLSDARLLSQKLKKRGEVFLMEKNSKQAKSEWINALLKKEGVAISPRISYILTNAFDSDLSRFNQEWEKMIAFAGKNGKISQDVLDAVVILPDNENVFELLHLFFQPDYTSFSQKLRMILCDRKKTVQEIFGLLSWFLKRLFLLKYFLQKRLSLKEIAEEFKTKEWSVKKMLPFEKKVRQKHFCTLFSLLYASNIALRENKKSEIMIIESLFFDFKDCLAIF